MPWSLFIGDYMRDEEEAKMIEGTLLYADETLVFKKGKWGYHNQHKPFEPSAYICDSSLPSELRGGIWRVLLA